MCAIFFAIAGTAPAVFLFSENFNYTIGSNLAGQNGGSGFSGAWSGGDSTIVAGLGGAGNAVQEGTTLSSRSLSSTFSTSGNSFYISFLVRVSNFSGGNYAGISLWNNGNEQLFFGIPWESKNFGFDAHAGNGAPDIKTVNFSPSTNTTYLVTIGFLPSATPGKVDVKMWATNDLSVNPDSFVGSSPNASILGVRNDFSFDTLRLNGNYASDPKIAGVAAATTAAEAINFTTAARSSNANLSALTLGTGSLVPVFDAATTNYTANVTKETASVAVTPVAAQADATIRIRVNGGAYSVVASGNPSAPLDLGVGPNTVDVLVAAQDGISTKNYAIVITRSSVSSNALLADLSTSSGGLTPSFAPGIKNYAVSVINAVSSVTVTSMAAQADAAIEIRSNGGAYAPLASGSPSAPLPLNVGPNTVDIKVTAQDSVTTETYNLTVTRGPQMLGSIPDQSFTIGSSAPNIPLALSGIQTNVTIRTLTANLTSGASQRYEDPGTRILKGLKPDVVMIQEFNVSNNTTQDLRNWVDSTFGPEFHYFRENSSSSLTIPNGVISRWPILAAGSWDDGDAGITDRNFAYSKIDIPGPRDLWIVSVHLKAGYTSTEAARRNTQAQTLVSRVTESVPSDCYLLIGGDFNTQNDSEQCLTTLSSVVDVTDKPKDEAGDADTNQGRWAPYDRLMAESELDALEVPFTVGNLSFNNGLVFDSRVFSDLSLVSPVLRADSDATINVNMQHMAVGRSFRISAADVVSFQVQSSNPSLLPAANVQVLGTGTNRSISIVPLSGQTGTSTVTITVSDGVSTDTRSFNVSVTGSSFASWSSNAPVTGELMARYAIGGATNSTSASPAQQFNASNGQFWISAVVRTNDPLLSVVGEASGNLGSWTTNGVTDSPAADTTGVPDGCQRRIYSVELSNNPSMQFLRLKATLSE